MCEIMITVSTPLQCSPGNRSDDHRALIVVVESNTMANLMPRVFSLSLS